MKGTGKDTETQDGFEQRYRKTLARHLQNPGEATLRRGYELGREAIARGKSLLDTVSAHQRILKEGRPPLDEPCRYCKDLAAASDFLLEVLSPFEMTHRGFRDAVLALRQTNETLEEQMKRLAYAVHDEAGQLLVAVHLAVAEMTKEVPAAHRLQIERIDELLQQVEDELRRISHELRPTTLDDLGWLPAVRSLARRISARACFPVEVKASMKERLGSTQETILYRVVQEALTNAAKHSRASRASVAVHSQGRLVVCTVRDNGVGFHADARENGAKSGGLGLTAMRERLHSIGGSLTLVSFPGRGTKVHARFPVEVTSDISTHAGR